MSVARFLVLLFPFVAAVHGASVPPVASTDKEARETVDWEVQNGCIQNYQIKRVNFIDNSTGIMELSGNRKVKVTLVNACSGIRQDGYVHKPVNNQFCEGDILRIMRSGGVCVVDTLEPYVEPDPDKETSHKETSPKETSPKETPDKKTADKKTPDNQTPGTKSGE